MSHITIDWIDWAWKTIKTKFLWWIMFFKYQRLGKKQILKNLEDPQKSMGHIFWLVDQEGKNYIMDRSLISLVVYYINNWKTINTEEQKEIIRKFLWKLNWSIVIMMMCDYETCKNRLKFREHITGNLSTNDKKLLNDPEYFQSYYNWFSKIFDLIKEIIKEDNLNIKAIKINSPQIPIWSISKKLFLKLPKWWQKFIYTKLFE